MQTFIEQVATRLYEKYGDDVSSLTVLFASRRARLFFSEALLSVASHPLWAPNFVSVDDLMCSISSLRSADRLKLVVELYKIYSEYHKEDFDKFYHWGEMLVSDFDMIDKYLVDASQLFANIADIKEIEANIDYLTEEQIAIIRQFWNTLSGSNTLSENKARFLGIWKSLGVIYNRYKSRLKELGIGYTGMIYRDAAEIIEAASASVLPDEKYVVVGFNALSATEKRLFAYLRSNHNADFFWDYDDYYFKSDMQEAGRFVRENVAAFPPEEGITHNNLKNIAQLNIVSTATSASQCKYAAQLLAEIAGRDENGNIKPLDRDTAVILTDENLLMPLLYSLPEEFKSDKIGDRGGVNVTMGYPLRNTLAYSFVERLLELQSHIREKDGQITFYYVDVEGLLTHPYIADLSAEKAAAIRKTITEERVFNVPQSMLSSLEIAERLFCYAQGAVPMIDWIIDVVNMVLYTPSDNEDGKYRNEYLMLTLENLAKLKNLIIECGMEITQSVCRSLIRKHLQSVRIAFSGEPLEGLQVMGILETRNLDFKNVIILSMSDSNFPGTKVSDSSFVPYNLRYAYSLPTNEHHEGVYAYYFYRLIQRAENVWLLYSSQADDKGSGEPSRYIRQLVYESMLPISSVKVGVDVNVEDREAIVIEKSADVAALLEKYTSGDKSLSPTAVSTFVRCPLKFYFNYLAKMKVVEDVEQSVDDRVFGNIFHKSAELLYTKVIGVKNPSSLLSAISDNQIEEAVYKAICEEYFGGRSVDKSALQGEIDIIYRIVVRYLKDNLIAYDLSHCGFTVTQLESVFSHKFSFQCAGKNTSVILEGRADRIDTLEDGTLRIIDYKTGSSHLMFAGFDRLFNGSDIDRQSNTINTLIYSMIKYHTTGVDVQPALFYLRDMYTDKYSPLLRQGQGAGKKSVPVERYSAVADEFEENLFAALALLFDTSQPFTQTEDVKTCQYCDYRRICAKK